MTANVPSSRIWGFEAQGNVRPAQWLEIGGSMAYTNAKFTDGNIQLFGTPYAYGPVGDTPKFSGTAYAQITMPVGDNMGDVSLRGEVYGQSAQYFSNAAASIAPGHNAAAVGEPRTYGLELSFKY